METQAAAQMARVFPMEIEDTPIFLHRVGEVHG